MARHFTELDCWKLADELRTNVVRIARRPIIRRDRDYHSDMLDAAASAPNNIAEGFGRWTHADFAHFLDNARGSLQELQSQFKDGYDRGYMSREEARRLTILAKRASGAVAGLQRYLRPNR